MTTSPNTSQGRSSSPSLLRAAASPTRQITGHVSGLGAGVGAQFGAQFGAELGVHLGVRAIARPIARPSVHPSAASQRDKVQGAASPPRPGAGAPLATDAASSGQVSRGAASVTAAWARLGASFAVAPAAETPDVERLIVETVREGRDNARLLIMAAAWLRRHGACVARHRLAQLAQSMLGESERAVLGWLLEESSRAAEGSVKSAFAADEGSTTGKRSRSAGLPSPGRFREAQAVCRPARRLQPVFRVHERHPAILERLAAVSSPTARRWNLLAEPIDAKPDALRSREWVWANNAELTLRALLGGDLRASILAVLTHDETAGASELELARRCCASRAAVRDALLRLEEAGLVRRTHVGRRREIRLAGAG